jgi:hypothetical protein
MKAGWQMACVITAILLLTIRSLMLLLEQEGHFSTATFLQQFDSGMRLTVWALMLIVVWLTVSSGIQHLLKNRDFFFRPGAM